MMTPITCKATRRNILLALTLTTAYAALSSRARAEVITATVESDRKYSAELKPLPMLVLLVPGGVGIAGEFEAKMTRNTSVFADAYHLHMRLPDSLLRDAQKNHDESESLPSGMDASGVAAGVRYYGNGTYADSWYLGARLGGGTSHTSWVYKDERLQDEALSYTSGVDVGYRWLWSSGFLVRLGIGMNATNVARRDVTALASTDADALAQARRDVEGKAPSRATTLGTSFDLGLGWSF